jgi:hypothetical protein
VFFFFSNRMGWLASIVLSLVVSMVLLVLFRVF